ncbi:MAG: PfkB family carbohydrate kinase [Gammaproteobacteria bacterium]|nr:PfkB family carbohydrate kinase [Gammaproteobacteria bacterium]
MSNILLTGIATLDIINQVDHYPPEDSEIRALNQIIRCGGNACNSAIILQQLGITPYLLTNRADDSNADQIFSELAQHSINTTLCPIQKNSSTPTSYITSNTKNGSRSIIHYRNLNELNSAHFKKINLSTYDWLHFEARNCQQLEIMLQYAKTFNKPISIEVEKNREFIELITPFADVLLLSRPFAQSRGFDNALTCIKHFSSLYKDKIITCTWGSQGAWLYANSEIQHQLAFEIDKSVETLGAGDTFNAGFISSLINNLSPPSALQFACQLAANKCLQSGFDNIIIPA